MKCRQCSKPVEPTREQWATPICWACVRPTGVEGLLQEAYEERDAATARAAKAELQVDALHATRDAHKLIIGLSFERSQERDAALARAEKAEAERDVARATVGEIVAWLRTVKATVLCNDALDECLVKDSMHDEQTYWDESDQFSPLADYIESKWGKP